MKSKINFLLFTGILSFLISVKVSGQITSQEQSEKNANVEMYYFHFNTRCETCRAVESEAQQDVKELFGDDVSFAACNLDEATGEKKGKELGVDSQMLLVVKGDKRVDLTNEGFLYARTNPEKFKKIIEEKIKPLL